MIWAFSRRCESAHEELDAGEEEPGFGAGDGGFGVLGEAAIAIEPSQGALDDPAARQHLEALYGIGSLDDLEGPSTEPLERAGELGSGVSAVGEDVARISSS